MDDLVFKSKTMWLCASCETCTTRRPQKVDVAKVMDAVKIIALRGGIKPAIPQVASFYKAALDKIEEYIARDGYKALARVLTSMWNDPLSHTYARLFLLNWDFGKIYEEKQNGLSLDRG